jgi:hypothetical protein
MTERERILKILNGEVVDRIPWIPRLKIWYIAHKKNNTLPEKYRNSTLREIERDLGMGNPAREGKIYNVVLHNVEKRVIREGGEIITEYITPIGTVFEKQVLTPELERVGIEELEKREHLIKRSEDYSVVEYIIEHTEYVPCFEEFEAYDCEIGEEGLSSVLSGECPMFEIMLNYVGYERFYYELYDRPEKIEHLHELLSEKMEEVHRIMVESPAILFRHGEHFDSQLTPPPIYKKYFLPYYKRLSRQIHDHGKFLAVHLDADTRLLLDLIYESGFDVADAFTTAPMVRCTLKQAREVWEDRVVIWGGIPSIILCEGYPEDDFREQIEKIFRVVAPGRAFIFGVGDNIMPETKFDRLLFVGEMITRWGTYPMSLPETGL